MDISSFLAESENPVEAAVLLGEASKRPFLLTLRKSLVQAFAWSLGTLWSPLATCSGLGHLTFTQGQGCEE